VARYNKTLVWYRRTSNVPYLSFYWHTHWRWCWCKPWRERTKM